MGWGEVYLMDHLKSNGKKQWLGLAVAIVVYMLAISSSDAQTEQSLMQRLQNPSLHIIGFALGGVGAFLTLAASYFRSPAGGMKDLRGSPFGHKILFILSGGLTGTIVIFTMKKPIFSFVAGVSWPTVVTSYQGASQVVTKAAKLYLESRAESKEESLTNKESTAGSNEQQKDTDDTSA